MFKEVFLKHWLDWTIAIIVMVFILVMGAIQRYSIEQDYNFTSDEIFFSIKLHARQQQSPAVSPTDTSGWKTYRNEKYGFEFRYPGDWFMQQERDELLVRDGRVIIYFNNQQRVDFENHKISLNLQHVDNSFFVEHVRSNKPFSVIEGTDVSSSIILVDDREVVLQEITYSEQPDSLLPRKTTTYEIVIPLGKNTLFIESQTTYKSTLDQILFTFKFFEPKR